MSLFIEQKNLWYFQRKTHIKFKIHRYNGVGAKMVHCLPSPKKDVLNCSTDMMLFCIVNQRKKYLYVP